jgi:hypothetical protein
MRAVRMLAVVSFAAVAAFAENVPDFPQTTHVAGKVPMNLAGAWFLYAQAEFPGGKSRALQPELWTISQKSDHEVDFRLLDVELPKSIDEPYRAANRQTKAWEPSPADLTLLRKEWAKLPPATNKDVHKSDVAYGSIEVTVASPDKYAEVFQVGGTQIEEALKGSKFALQVLEKFRPLPVPPGENVAQVMERKSIYIVRNANDSMLEGKQFTGYVAAGPGTPIPISFVGPFRLYRLAKGNVGPAASAPSKKSKAKK